MIAHTSLMKFSSQNAAVINGAPTAKPSRAFALWLALLLLYFLLLPTAADTPKRDAQASASEIPAVSLAPRHEY